MTPTDPTLTAAQPAPTDGPESARVLIGRQLHMLSRLADIGMRIAEAAGERAVAALEAGDEPGTKGDPALIYAKAARAVRMSIALQSRLMADLAALDKDDAFTRATRTGERRVRVQKLVERAIAAEGCDLYETRRLSGDARERLTDEDIRGALLDRPLGEMVARICRDLGLSPDWGAWATEPWATEPWATEAATADAANAARDPPSKTRVTMARAGPPAGGGLGPPGVDADPGADPASDPDWYKEWEPNPGAAPWRGRPDSNRHGLR